MPRDENQDSFFDFSPLNRYNGVEYATRNGNNTAMQKNSVHL